MRILIRNFNKHCYFLQFHHSSILNNNSCRPFCIFLLENGKTKNLQIQLEQQLNYSSSFSTFNRLNQTLHIEELLKQRTKRNFSIAKFSTEKEHSDKHAITLAIETLDYSLKLKRLEILFLLVIRMRHDKENGNKWIHLSQKFPFANNDFPNIPLPKDAYLWIKGMDSLIKRLADYEDEHPICEVLIKGGHSYEYKFEIGPNKKDGKLTFTMKTITKNTQKMVAEMSLPIQLLPLVRERMAKMLTEFDGTQKITSSSTQIPKWILLENDVNELQQPLYYRDTLDYKVDDKPRDRKIQIEYKQGATGIEFIQITQTFDKRMDVGNIETLYFHFANIPIQDAQQLLGAMEIMSMNRSSMICHQFVQGLWYDYKLEIHSYPNKQLNINMQTILNAGKKNLHMPIKLYGPVPIEIFHWLKEQMAEILLVSSSSSSSNKSQEAEPLSNLESNYPKKEILRIEKLPFISFYGGKYHTMFAVFEMNQSKNNRKWINLYDWLHFTAHKFVRIPTSDAYSLVKAMDELINKLVDLDKPPNCPILVRDREGLIYNYKVRIHPSDDGRLEFRMDSITTAKNPSHKPKQFYGPVGILPLLRDQMAKMLVDFDGTKQIAPSPSSLPKWIAEDKIKHMLKANEMNKEKWEILRKETFDFNVNVVIGKQDRKMVIQLQRNKLGEEFIQIEQEFDKQLKSTNIEEDNSLIVPFPPIPLKIAYPLLDAMHTLSTDMEKKSAVLQISNEIIAKENRGIESDLEICQQRVNGLHYDYKMEIFISYVSKQLEFRLQTMTMEADPSHKSRKLYGPIPLYVFDWLKEQMAELLKSSSNQQEQKICQIEPLEFKEINENEPIAYKEKDNKIGERLFRLEIEHYRVEGESQNRIMKIEFHQGKSGKKCIQIVQRFTREGGIPDYFNFPNILVPEDVYPFLDAMHAMSSELQEKRLTLLTGENKSSMICQQIVKGLIYDYKMEIHSCKNQNLYFRLKTMPNKANKWHKSKELLGPIPISMFNWVKEKMTEMLDDCEKLNGKTNE